MNELLFVGTDIMEETKMLMKFNNVLGTYDMSVSEYEAYQLGIKNTLAALGAVLEADGEELIVNIPGMEIPQEFDIVDLEHYLFSV